MNVEMVKLLLSNHRRMGIALNELSSNGKSGLDWVKAAKENEKGNRKTILQLLEFVDAKSGDEMRNLSAKSEQPKIAKLW